MKVMEILEQIRKLPENEQLLIAEVLWEELQFEDDDLTPAQAAELGRRIKDHQKNPEAGIPWEQVKAEAEARLTRVRQPIKP
jgi:putative addiction module component (TIGR02574 family)